MRIVGGKYAGRHLTSPAKRVRPTTEGTRVAWVEWMERELKGARLLELCAGTGAVGLEALSRGAKYVDLVERDPRALHALKANVAALRVPEKVRIFKKDAVPFTQGLDEDAYDVVLADPPYGSGVGPLLVDIWRERRYAKVFALEHAADHEVPNGAAKLKLGDTTITLYRFGARV